MGEVIENKVVQLAFDNTKFEKGVQATLNILGRLNNAITGINTIKYNILGLADQVKAVTFDPVNAQLQIGVGKAMALTAALTGVYNITDQIYNTMVGTIRSMTFDQITNGFNRYEQIVNSTQTILASTRKEGESMEDAMERVSEVQEKLLWFADETSYDAQAMLATISQFTSHGIELNEASTAMEGIANWAATAGVNATEATYAMQQLAQTIGKGYVQSQDWVSIQTRNMDTTKFKELIIDAAVARGELKKLGNEITTLDGKDKVTSANMEKSLSKKWFTKEVLMDVLKKYGEANEIIRREQREGELVSETIERVKNMSEYQKYMLSIEAFEMGQVARTWTDAYESVQTAVATKISGIFKTIFGDYLEAKNLWTDVSEKLYDIFVSPLDTLLQAFQKWSDPKGMKGALRFWDSIYKIFEAIEATVEVIWTSVSSVFGIVADENSELEGYVQRASGWVNLLADVINKISIKFDRFSKNFSDFFERLRNNEKIWNNLEAFLRGVKIGFDLLSQAVNTFKDRVLTPILGKAESGIESFSGLGTSFEQMMIDFQALVDKTDLFNKVFDTTEEILSKIIDGVVLLIDTFSKLFTDTEKVGQGKNGEGGIFSKIAEDVTGAEGPLEKFGIIFGKIIDSLSYGFEHAIPLLENVKSVFAMVFGGIANVFMSLQPALEKVGGTIKYIFDAIIGAIASTGGNIGGTFEQIGAGIATLITDVNSGNVANFEKFLEVIHNEVAFYKDLLFGGMTIPEFLNNCCVALFYMAAGISLITSVLTDLIVRVATLSKIIEVIQEFQWYGILGGLLWGDSLTNITDQLYYKALAQTFAAVADGILMIAAALFVISLVDPERMQSSLDTLKSIAGIMFQLIIVVEIIGTIFDKLSQWGNVAREKKGGVLGFIGGLLGFDTNAFVTTARYAGMAAMIASISTAFLKAALALILLATIKPEDMSRAKGALFAIAGTIMVMFAMASLLSGNSGNFSYMNILGGAKNYKTGKFASDSMGAVKGALAIVLIAMAISKMAKSLKLIAEIPEDDIWRAVGVISIMTVLTIVLMTYATAMSKWMQEGNGSKNIVAIGHMVSRFGLAILLIAGALALLTKVSDLEKLPEAAKWLGIAFGAFSAAIMAFMILVQTMDSVDVAAFGALTGIILALAVSIVALAGSLVLIANVADPTKIEKAASCLGIIFVAFAALIWSSSAIRPSQVMAVASALAIMNLSTLALIPLLSTVMKIDEGAMERLKQLFIGLGIAMTAFMTVAAILANAQVSGAFIGYLFAIIGALAALSTTGLIISAGVLMLSAAFSIFIDSLKKFEELDGEKIKSNLLQMASFIPELLVVLTQSLTDSLNVLLTQPFDFTLLFTNILKGIVDAFSTMLPKIITTLTNMFTSLLEALKVLVPLVLDFVNWFGVELTKAVVEGTIKITFALFEGFVSGMEDILPRVPEVINRFADVLIANLSDILDAMDRLIDPIADIIDHSIKHVITILERSSGSIRTLVSTLFTLILNLANDFGVILTEKVTEGTIRILFAVVQGLIVGISEAIPDLLEACGKAVIDLCNGIADVLDEQGDEIIKAIDRLMKSIGDFILKLVLSWGAEGGVFFEGGLQIVAGITRGITSRLKLVKEAAFSLGDYVKNGFCKVLQIQSPSKVFEQFGKFIPEGLLNGLAAMKDKVFEKFGAFASGIASQFGINLSGGLGGGIEDLLGGMLGSLNVDIIPNLDLTNLNGQLGDLTSLFGAQQLQGMVGLEGFNMSDISAGMDSVSLVNGMDAIDGKLDQLITIEKFNAEKPTDVNIAMQGDTSKFFKAMRTENNKRTRTTGYNALLGAKA